MAIEASKRSAKRTKKDVPGYNIMMACTLYFNRSWCCSLFPLFLHLFLPFLGTGDGLFPLNLENGKGKQRRELDVSDTHVRVDVDVVAGRCFCMAWYGIAWTLYRIGWMDDFVAVGPELQCIDGWMDSWLMIPEINRHNLNILLFILSRHSVSRSNRS